MHAPIPTKPGQLTRHDYEYERKAGSKLLYQSCFEKTIEGRAKRLRKRLIAAMPERGRRVSNKSGGYLRLQRGNPSVSLRNATVGALRSSCLVRDHGLSVSGADFLWF
jgi:hypothetical protein